MKLVTITEATKLTGRSRSTLYRDISSGRLSATASDTGGKVFDVSELIRVYGKLLDTMTRRETVPMEHGATGDETHTIATLKAQIDGLRELVSSKDQHISSLERSNEDLRASIRLLENKAQRSDTRPWLLRMFG